MNTDEYSKKITEDAEQLRSILLNRGAEWLCKTLANICLDIEMDAAPDSPIEQGWIARRKAFDATSRKMTKISGDLTRTSIAREIAASK